MAFRRVSELATEVTLGVLSLQKETYRVHLHPKVIDDYIKTELSGHRVAGPFSADECTLVNINHFGVIPKHHQANKWHLIVDLSHPEGFSINDGVPSHLCTLSYITVDDAVQEILGQEPCWQNWT